MAILDPAIVRIENLNAYLEAQGLEVVRGQWLRGDAYPMLFVRLKGDKAAPVDVAIPPMCSCGHRLLLHDPEGGCCFVHGCECRVYDPMAAA